MTAYIATVRRSEGHKGDVRQKSRDDERRSIKITFTSGKARSSTFMISMYRRMSLHAARSCPVGH